MLLKVIIDLLLICNVFVESQNTTNTSNEMTIDVMNATTTTTLKAPVVRPEKGSTNPESIFVESQNTTNASNEMTIDVMNATTTTTLKAPVVRPEKGSTNPESIFVESQNTTNASNETTIDVMNITTITTTMTTTTTTTTTTSSAPVVRPMKGSTEPESRPESIYPTPVPFSTARACDTSQCRLPDCKCSGTDTPNGMAVKDIPQMVMITFDDAITSVNKPLYDELTFNRTNPNGCPILFTFHVSHEWTEYSLVQELYSRGHEMASHTISHIFGGSFSVDDWVQEIVGQREILCRYGGVNLADVRGMRCPFLNIGADNQFKMLYKYNFTYDSTMPVRNSEPPYWPYTLDYAISHDCVIQYCPTQSFPGVWEVPLDMYPDGCSMADGCVKPTDEEGVYEMLLRNFNRHYQSNKAPFPLYYHSAYFYGYQKKGFIKFLNEINAKNDVFFVTQYQVIQWLRDPTPLSAIQSFKPWFCDFSDRPAPCNKPNTCVLYFKWGNRYFKTCQLCPQEYPWLGNTGF